MRADSCQQRRLSSPASREASREGFQALRTKSEFRSLGPAAIAEADTLLLTVPNQLGVDYNAHVIEAILKEVAPGMGWR